MITVHLKNGKKVARFDYGQLTEGTETFQGIWKEFQKKGVPVAGAGEKMKDADVDQEFQSKELGSFLVALQLAGYRVVDKEGEL